MSDFYGVPESRGENWKPRVVKEVAPVDDLNLLVATVFPERDFGPRDKTGRFKPKRVSSFDGFDPEVANRFIP